MSDFPYTNLRHYLEVHGYLAATGEVLDQAKKQYFKLYQRAYRAASKKQQVNVLLGKNELDHLKEKAGKYGLKKSTQYIIHLIRSDKEGKSSRPNLLIDIEVGLLKVLDSLSKKMGASPELRAQLIDTTRQLEEILLILTS